MQSDSREPNRVARALVARDVDAVHAVRRETVSATRAAATRNHGERQNPVARALVARDVDAMHAVHRETVAATRAAATRNHVNALANPDLTPVSDRSPLTERIRARYVGMGIPPSAEPLMTDSNPFSTDYVTARARFVEAAQRVGAEIESHPIGPAGPDGEVLTTDVARLGDPTSSRALVVSSGLHGIEGFFGSAVQLRILEEISTQLQASSSLNLILLHALNPHGFAQLRRCDETNIDLNRNFVLEGEAYRGCPPRYAELDGLLNPKRPPNRRDPFWLRANWAILRYGFHDLKQAIAGGQFEFPTGCSSAAAGRRRCASCSPRDCRIGSGRRNRWSISISIPGSAARAGTSF